MKTVKPFIINLSLSLLAICLVMAVMEIYLRKFWVQSSGNNGPLGHENWMKTYWRPINSLGYRDQEWKGSDLDEKTVVAIVGDSSIAGHGTNYISDRFLNMLANKLGSSYAVLSPVLVMKQKRRVRLAFW